MKLNGYTIDHQSDLSGANLSGLEIVNADITQATLAGANLAGSKVVNVQSRGASFERANLVKADLVGEDLEGVDFRHADLSGANFSEANLRGANFLFANLEGTIFRHANLAGATFANSHIHNADFSFAEFHGRVEVTEDDWIKRHRSCFALTDGVDIERKLRNSGSVSFAYTTVTNSSFIGANFGCDCIEKDLSLKMGVQYSKEGCCVLSHLDNFKDCDFSRANLYGLELGCNKNNKFQGANLQRAYIKMPGAHTRVGLQSQPFSDFRRADEKCGVFNSANLQNAVIRGLVFTNKEHPQCKPFSGANLNGVYFSHSYFYELDSEYKVLKSTPLSDFSEPQLRQILGC